MKKLISIILTVAVLFTAFVSVTANESTSVYIASEYFSLESNPNNPWIWMYYVNNSDNTGHGAYLPLETANANATTMELASEIWTPLTGLSEVYYNSNAWMHGEMYDIIVGPHLMKVSTRAINDSNKYNGAVRAFIAPKSGYVTIGAIDAMGGNKIFSPIKGAHEINHYLKINKKTSDGSITQIWPENGTSVLLTNDKKSVSFPSMSTYLEAGDVLYFEAYLGGQTKGASWCIQPVYWNPTIEYVTKFVASDYFDEESNSSNVWKWMYYLNNADNTGHGEYRTLDIANANATAIGVDEGSWMAVTGLTENYDDVRAWMYNEMYDVVVGPHLMKVSTRAINDNNKYNGAIRAFTAPRAGYVTVGAIDAMGGNKIFSPVKGSHEINHYLRINRQSVSDGSITQLWPENNEKVLLKYENQAVNFEPMSVYLEEGDTLYFEVHLGGQTKGASWCIQPVYWNPYVEYDEAKPSVTSVLPTDIQKVPTDGNITITYNLPVAPLVLANAELTSEEDDDMQIADIETSVDGYSVTFSFANLDENADYVLKLTGVKAASDADVVANNYSLYFRTDGPYEFAKYTASDSFSTISNTDGRWTWMYYGNDGVYTDLTRFIDAETAVTTNEPSWFAGNYAWGHVVSKTKMRTPTKTPVQGETDWDGVVRKFTVPRSGKVSISQSGSDARGEKYITAEINSSNQRGLFIRILREKPDGTKEVVWPLDENGEPTTYQFKWTNYDKDALLFEDLHINVADGEELYFEAYVGGDYELSGWGRAIAWNPTVSYLAYNPNIVESNIQDGETKVEPNREFTVKFDTEICEITADDIDISGGATIRNFALSEGNTRVTVSFENLQPSTAYSLSINNLRPTDVEVTDEHTFSYKANFVTDALVQLDGIYLVDGSELKTGANVVKADINNSAGSQNPFGATLLAVLCNGTEQDYVVEKAVFTSRNDIGENDSIQVSLEVENTANRFIKAVLLDDVIDANPLLKMVILGK